MKKGLSTGWRNEEASGNALAVPEWKFASFQQDGERKRIRKAKVFSILGAAKYTMILSLLLWWLPLFGQMVAGYVGGRKAGSPFRGLVAGFLPVVALFAIISFLDLVLQPSYAGTGSATSSLLASFGSGLPIIGPYMDFTRDYIGNFLTSLTGSSPYGMNSYVITLAFAYIGGILSDQTRREIEAVSGASGSHTTVIVAPSEKKSEPVQGHFRPVQPVIPGMRRSIFPFARVERRAEVESFDQLVPEDVVGVRDEQEHSFPKRSIPRKVIRKLKHPIEQGAHHLHHNQYEKKPVKMSANDMGSIAKAQKKVEKEWKPQQKKAVKFVPSDQKKHSGLHKHRKSWDSI